VRPTVSCLSRMTPGHLSAGSVGVEPLNASVISPFLLYAFLAVGAVGVCLALPRPKISPQLIGTVLAAAAVGGLFVVLARTYAPEPAFFYIFAILAVVSGIRVISHPRPVYSALYFIFTILSSSVLYLLAQAEFMAFALLIIYAGAILITYVFVIMLATQAPTEDQPEALSEYDAYSREPLGATILGFVLLAVLTGMMSRGVKQVSPRDAGVDPQARLADMPRKVIESLDRHGAFEVFDRPLPSEVGNVIDFGKRRVPLTMRLSRLPALEARVSDARFNALVGGESEARRLAESLASKGKSGSPFAKPTDGDEPASTDDKQTVIPVTFPADIAVENIEQVGFALVAKHPMALELAGVILTMAMLGAVVLARKQIELGEAEKAAAAFARTHTLPGPRGYGDEA